LASIGKKKTTTAGNTHARIVEPARFVNDVCHMSDTSFNRARFTGWVCRSATLAFLLAAAEAWPAPPASCLTKGPYLQAPGPTTMTLRWELLENLPAMVRYGRGRNLDRVQDITPPRTMLGVSTRCRTNVVTGVRTNITSYAVTTREVKELELVGIQGLAR
jgi:hypothetical protein